MYQINKIFIRRVSSVCQKVISPTRLCTTMCLYQMVYKVTLEMLVWEMIEMIEMIEIIAEKLPVLLCQKEILFLILTLCALLVLLVMVFRNRSFLATMTCMAKWVRNLETSGISPERIERTAGRVVILQILWIFLENSLEESIR